MGCLGSVGFEGQPQHRALLGLGVGDQTGERLDDCFETIGGIFWCLRWSSEVVFVSG